MSKWAKSERQSHRVVFLGGRTCSPSCSLPALRSVGHERKHRLGTFPGRWYTRRARRSCYERQRTACRARYSWKRSDGFYLGSVRQAEDKEEAASRCTPRAEVCHLPALASRLSGARAKTKAGGVKAVHHTKVAFDAASVRSLCA